MGIDQLTQAYIEQVIQAGDQGSALLAAAVAPTLLNSSLVEVLEEGMNGFAVLRVPDDQYCIVHSAAGDPAVRDPAAHAASMVERLTERAQEIGATPVGFADVVDAHSGDAAVIRDIGQALRDQADAYKLAVMNGELAILGGRINPAYKANVSGTMVSRMPKGSEPVKVPGTFRVGDTRYAVFDPAGNAVYLNADGIGTKTEIYERVWKLKLGLLDSLAMKLDDASKRAAAVAVVGDVVETSGEMYFDDLDKFAAMRGAMMHFQYILQHEPVGDRLMGYRPGESYNVSGTAVSTIDEERLRNPLRPQAGDALIAISGPPNPRSNGISEKRRRMVQMFGGEWETTETGRLFAQYLAQPSVVFYPLFHELIKDNLVSGVFHMSGGAYKGKLAKPLAKHGLFVRMDHLFPPDWRELALAGASLASAEEAYAMWPMGNDGFVTTSGDPRKVIDRITENKYYQNNCPLKPQVVGRLEQAADGKTGIEFVAANGKTVYYSGKE
ncbi:MAG TPA: hypothetical protein VJC16_02625 [Candidatus Nanoarchaeia archaeon]|nr:hypothetical protein [Candidatus Nanoarchaeia archaeon]